MEPLDRSTHLAVRRRGELGDFFYQRYGSPTVAAAEAALGELDGGTALLFPSGRRRDDGARPVAPPARRHDRARRGRLLRDRHHLRGARVAGGSASSSSTRPGRRPRTSDLVWLEAPSNPFLTMPDLEAAAAHPARVVVDATVATPVHLRPLEHGADFVLHSATKYLAGHDDALLGVVVCRDGAAAEELLTFRSRTGIVAAPDPAWLLLRGLKTLELRVRRQTETAGFLAERLRDHRRSQTVRYPGLGGLLSFDVDGCGDGAEGRDVDARDRQRDARSAASRA